jgi:hypothetical protein
LAYRKHARAEFRLRRTRGTTYAERTNSLFPVIQNSIRPGPCCRLGFAEIGFAGCPSPFSKMQRVSHFVGRPLMSDSRFARPKECLQPEPERPPSVRWARPAWQYCPSCKIVNDNAPIRPVSIGQNPQFSGTQTVLRTRVAAVPGSRCFGLRDVGAAPQNTGIPFGGVGQFGLVVEVDGVVGSRQPVAALPPGSRLFLF